MEFDLSELRDLERALSLATCKEHGPGYMVICSLCFTPRCRECTNPCQCENDE